MAIVEYLYIDETRLNAYTEQIGPGVQYDKVPEWKVSMGFTGPKAETRQLRPARPLTKHEKINTLVRYLEDNNFLWHKPASRHWRSEEMASPFILERFNARKIVVPGKQAAERSAEVTLWLSESGFDDFTDGGFVVLLEDDNQNDGQIPRHQLSAYSALVSLFRHSDGAFRQTILGSYAQNAAEMPKWSYAQMRAFAANPARTLGSYGCQVGESRSIESLYRVREWGPSVDARLELFGYPIYIAAAEGQSSIHRPAT